MTEGQDHAPSVVQNVTAVNGFAFGVIGADIHVFGNGLPLYLLANWQLAPQVLPDWLRQLPSRMLNARREIVPFTGRDSELASLGQWRDGDGRLAVRWLYGPGGQGKTRLAAQFADDSAAAGWKVVAAYHGPDADRPEPGSQDMSLTGVSGLLVIVDYADRWLLTNLTWLLKNALLHQTGVATRVLMLARTDDAWPRIRGVLDNYQADTSSHSLPALDQEGGGRASMFAAARDSFAAVYQLPMMSAVEPPGSLNDPEFGLTLALHMAALVAVDAHATGQRPPKDMAGLTIYLLDREQLHWARLYADGASAPNAELHSYSTPPEVMNKTVFTAALTGNADPAVAAVLLESLELPRACQTLKDHAFCYPPSDPGQTTVLEPLYPDRLAEDFLALTMPGHPADYPAQTWADSATTALLARHGDQGSPATWTPRAITFLSSAAHRWPHLGAGYLYPLLTGDPQLAIDAGNAALTTIASLPDADPAVMEAIESCLPKGRHADLDTGIAALVQRLTAHQLSTVTDPATRARLHVHLGWRLANAGQIQQSQHAYEEAIQLYRPLAATNLAEFGPDLALALNSLSARLAHLGRQDEALSAAEEGLQIRRRLADPAAFEHQFPESAYVQHRLAESLTSVGNRLAAMGRHEQAVLAAAEGVQIRRRLAAAEPTAFEPNLAIELSNLGNQLAGIGRREEALSAAEEAVRISRRLAAANPAAFENGLAEALNNLGLRLSDMGSREEALRVAQEAVQVFRRLVDANPAAFEPDLARSVDNLGQRLSAVGRREEGLAAAEEAIQIRQRLAAANPAAFEPGLASSLDSLSQQLSEMGHREEALKAAEKSVQTFRRLAQANSAASKPDLAATLNNLSLRLSAVGRREEALSMAEEAVQIFRRSAKANPAAVEPNLGRALNDLGNQLASLGRRQQAVAVTEESAEIFRRLSRANPAAFEFYLATALTNLSSRLSGMGRRQEALASAEDATQIWRRLAAANPAAFERSLTTAVHNLALRLSDMRRQEEALTLAEEAVGLYRGLAKANPAVSEPGLARALHSLAILLADLLRHEDAHRATEEATQIWQRLAAANPAAYESNYAASLDNLALRLSDLGRRQEALTMTERAVEIYRRLAKANPAASEPSLAGALNNLGSRLSDLGRRKEALTAAQTSVEIHRRLAKANPAAFEPGLASGLHNVGRRLSEVGRMKQAVAATQEAVQIRRRLAAANPTAFEPALGDSLINLGAQLRRIGKRGQAQIATGQAIQIYRRLAGTNPAVYETRLTLALRNASALHSPS